MEKSLDFGKECVIKNKFSVDKVNTKRTVVSNTNTEFPQISAGPQISANL